MTIKKFLTRSRPQLVHYLGCSVLLCIDDDVSSRDQPDSRGSRGSSASSTPCAGRRALNLEKINPGLLRYCRESLSQCHNRNIGICENQNDRNEECCFSMTAAGAGRRRSFIHYDECVLSSYFNWISFRRSIYLCGYSMEYPYLSLDIL